METGDVNPSEVWDVKKYKDDGTVEGGTMEIFYETTSKPNGVITYIDVKNPIRNKSKYLEAVKSQLTYFDNVTLEEHWDDDDYVKHHDFKTDILYQDDNMIIPKSNYYSVPHLVLNGVNYGTIDFAEMEMDEKRGNIGIIGDPSEIDVNQSRESVRYTEKTRNAIKQYLKNSIVVAQNFINDEFRDMGDDFLKWVHACRQVKSRNHNTNSVFSRLSGLADLEQVELGFTIGDVELKYTERNFRDIFKGFKVSKISVNKYDKVYRTSTADVTSWGDFSGDNLMYRSSVLERSSPIKLGYISEEILKDTDTLYMLTPIEESGASLDEKANQEFLCGILSNSERYISYEDVEVPADFLQEYEEATKKHEEEKEAEAKEAAMSLKEIRQRDGKFVYHQFKTRFKWGRTKYDADTVSKTRLEAPLDGIESLFTKENTIYGTSENIPLIYSLLHTCGKFQRIDYSDNYFIGNEDFQIVVVSKDVAKFFQHHATHVKQALQTFNNKTLGVMSKIRDYNTARQFNSSLKSHDYTFISLFENVDKDAYLALNDLLQFAEAHGFKYKYKSEMPNKDEIESYLDKLTDLQLFINEHKSSPDLISAKAAEVFNNPGIENCDSLNLKYYAMFKALEDYTELIRPIFKLYSVGTDYCEYLNTAAIREYLEFKGVQPYADYLKDRNEEFGVKEEQETINN